MWISFYRILQAILWFIWIGVLLYISLCIFVFFIQKSLIFFPIKENVSFPWQPNLKEISIKTEDGILLNAWYLDNKSDKTVIFFHGNGGNISYNQERLVIFNELHFNAIMIDYRWYGKSKGNIQKEEDIYKDADAAYKYIIDKGVNPKNIIIWGQSLGGAIAIYLAQNKDIYATIIESSFYSMDSMAANIYRFLPTLLLLRFHLRSDEKIENIISPILLIHSRNDEIINFSNGQKLYEKAKGHKEFLETTGSHNGGFQKSYNLYVSTLKKFLKQ